MLWRVRWDGKRAVNERVPAEKVSHSHRCRRNPSAPSGWFLSCPGLHLRRHPQDQPDYSRALRPGCHLSCSPWSAVGVATETPQLWIRESVEERPNNAAAAAANTGWLVACKGYTLTKTSLPRKDGAVHDGDHTWFSSPLLLTSLPLRCLSTPTTGGATASSVRQFIILLLVLGPNNWNISIFALWKPISQLACTLSSGK